MSREDCLDCGGPIRRNTNGTIESHWSDDLKRWMYHGWAIMKACLSRRLAQRDAEIANAMKMYDAARTEIDRLQIIVGKMPKTADGVAITPDMVVWILREGGEIDRGDVSKVGLNYVVIFGLGGGADHFADAICYSTRTAAEAARVMKGGQES